MAACIRLNRGLQRILWQQASNSMSIEEAYRKIIADSKSAGRWYVNLYCSKPFYGGPEEGGWWGRDVVLVETKMVSSEEVAIQLKDEVEKEAVRLTIESKRQYGERCLRETEWLDRRGLDDDYLPQPDGPCSYYVLIETVPGEAEHRGNRQYE